LNWPRQHGPTDRLAPSMCPLILLFVLGAELVRGIWDLFILERLTAKSRIAARRIENRRQFSLQFVGEPRGDGVFAELLEMPLYRLMGFRHLKLQYSPKQVVGTFN